MSAGAGLRFAASVALLVAAPACERGSAHVAAAGRVPPVLLFDGAGTSANDVAAVERLLRREKLDYATVDSAELDALDDERLRSARLLIVPGGNFLEIGNHLRASTAARVRGAVRGGLGYLGICAGAFFAGGADDYLSLNLTSGVKFHFYSAEERGVRKAAVPIAGAGTPTLEQYWEDGPELSGWGQVVARYPDGKPAIVQGASGAGWVLLTGVHPEAPEDWRRGMTFATPADVDNAFAVTLIRAALDRTPLPHD
jgi:glutamine amidotransferase-like uncharacterized protein